ncbi:hypothetical protein [Sanguibacter antarcticus]|uniref:Uncharacterized protein n=1 Tax=Sanguibacter antarcticus TaxID=372484 RepID=A0A2A9E3U1_9MICO|nr:hypothetical protein [Sanguibacter antarcticus]PFG33025.1 hypothetical protein ATL42_0877 [Sanguibacter antarcticus]
MMSRTWWASTGLVGTGFVLTLSGCADAGALNIVNDSDSQVVVQTGDQDATVPAWGGVSILDYGCTPGDVTVELASGQQTVLSGPVCPDQQIVVRGDIATLEPAASPDA